jgi:hypothetical protein
MKVSMRAIVSVLFVVVAFQGAAHAQPAPGSAPAPGSSPSPPSSQPYPGPSQAPVNPPYPAPPGQPYQAPYPGQPYPTPGQPYPTPMGPYPPPHGGVIPPYQYVPIQLSEDEQALLSRGEISDRRYIAGVLATVFFGLGVGQAIHGRYQDTGWIFTFGEAGSVLAMIVGAVRSISDCDYFDNECADSDDGEALLIGGLVGYVVFRAWELVDSFGAPPRHNARVRELRMRLGLPLPMASRVQPYVAPTMSRDGGGTAGLTFRF